MQQVGRVSARNRPPASRGRSKPPSPEQQAYERLSLYHTAKHAPDVYNLPEHYLMRTRPATAVRCYMHNLAHAVDAVKYASHVGDQMEKYLLLF